MNIRLPNLNQTRRILILLIIYMISGSVYSTINSNVQWLPVLGIVLLLPNILANIRSKVSREEFHRGLFLYGFIAIVIINGFLRRASLASYIRLAFMFAFAATVTLEFSFDEFRKIYIRFVTAVTAIDTVIYFILQRVGSFNFLPIATNGNLQSYRIGIIYNYLTLHPERNAGIYWEPGVFVTIIAIAFLLELLFEEKVSVWRAILYHVCVIATTASAAGVVLILFCDLILVYRLMERVTHSKTVAYLVFFLLYVLLIIAIANLDYIIIFTGLNSQRAFERLMSDSFGNSARMQAITKNMELFLSAPLFGKGIASAYETASNFSDTSTTTFMMVEFGIWGLIPTLRVIASIIGLKRDVITTVTVITVFLFILNKEPHTGIVIVWIIMFYFLKDGLNETYVENGMNETYMEVET